ncbi:inositol phospholipid synthesis protein Scs3p [Colletotrichum tamarilloi]|uniref:Acyl-coenzyme A diphosphatase SCS3 n=1 Tax=Colletotrichum tamarilloi TaxID=1209934 RepID=A0ABQ9QVW0_9PEZI|nr:inositol phospholipid synthesis protein Scs3p [Colletotrichum tamarilloi]KAK1486775.1 inositol phospholipid synthesis protein Scs3p [Colletotrichum tamarilloi]
MDTPPAVNLRSKTRRALDDLNGATTSPPSTPLKTTRNSPYLPTPIETIVLAAFPVILFFGTVFSLLSPDVRSSEYDPAAQAHVQDSAPSYFARKSNLFNVIFVKRGWFWITAAFFGFILTHPATAQATARVQGTLRWALVTTWWFFVTQWFFGPALIDRGFRWTGGKCEIIEEKVEMGEGDAKEVFTAVACKASGGRWRGGHDISGHVFLLVLGTGFLLSEVGWVVMRWRGSRREERSVVMTDGATKTATVEAQGLKGEPVPGDALGLGGKFAAAIIALSSWMLLMTAIYFHTWFEKVTGLVTALAALYGVYVLPRFIPAIRQVVGLPDRPMSPIKAPVNLPELVKAAFNKARSNGDLTYYATQVTVLNANSTPFQLRFSPALANKPVAQKPKKTDEPRKPFDPFESPEKGPLFIAEIPSSSGHNLVLNKFAIVPEHFILATKEFKQQTDLLERDDLAATYSCIEAYRQYGEQHQGHNSELYAFFNSGSHSGASQPHRHIQLLPVARMMDGLPDGARWDVLAKQLGPQHVSELPFLTFAETIHRDMSPDELHGIYLSLFKSAVDAVESHIGAENDSGNGGARISYNLAMTSDRLAVLPRLAEGAAIFKDGTAVGNLALNGTVLAGTALVKNEAEWDALRSGGDGDGVQLLEVLSKIGVPKDSGGSHTKKL